MWLSLVKTSSAFQISILQNASGSPILSRMHRLFSALLGSLCSAFKPRSELIIENLALRQQLAVLKEKKPRPRLTNADRAFWIVLRGLWSRWSEALVIVKPETVVRWHRAGFRQFWRWRSRRRRVGRPRVSQEIRNLIQRLSRDNPPWGAPRIHGELSKLGFDVCERTVLRYLAKRAAPPGAAQCWTTFLRNHASEIAAMDFFTVPTVTFRVLYAFFAIHHESRRILHINVTEHPTSAWIAQQLREAFPFDTAPRFLVHDRDSKFGGEVLAMIEALGIISKPTSYRSPWQNGLCERWVLSCRREMADHVVPLGEHHLLRLLRSYILHYHEDRTHLGLAKETPSGRLSTSRPSADGTVVALPRVGGLQHRYEWRNAA